MKESREGKELLLLLEGYVAKRFTDFLSVRKSFPVSLPTFYLIFNKIQEGDFPILLVR
jgi:hypothetical protein